MESVTNDFLRWKFCKLVLQFVFGSAGTSSKSNSARRQNALE